MPHKSYAAMVGLGHSLLPTLASLLLESCQHSTGWSTDEQTAGPPNRQYPQIFEKIVPVALAIIALVVLVLLIVIVAIALGFFPAGG